MTSPSKNRWCKNWSSHERLDPLSKRNTASIKDWNPQFRALELWVLFCILDLDIWITGFEVSFGEGRRLHRSAKGGDFTQLWSNQVLQLHSKLRYFCHNLRSCRWLIMVSRIQREWSGSHCSLRNLTIGGYQTWKVEAMKIKPGSHLCRKCHSNQGQHHNELVCSAPQRLLLPLSHSHTTHSFQRTGRTDRWLQLNRLSSRKYQLQFKTPVKKLPIV